jgi:serine phosphatase RsbU (regulator of sigma subunit)/pSer/pThr/pTyr-binding forkhead associated (FHA) protein
MSARLIVADPSGRRSITVDKPVVTLGRSRDRDVCVQDAGVSRLHAEILLGEDGCRIRDRESKFGTFVNGTRKAEHALSHGDRIRLGESDNTEIVFLIGEEETSQQRGAVEAASELRHMAGLLEGLRALGSDRVLDDVLALVIDSAIEVTGAERGFIMLANPQGRLEFKLARGRGGMTLSGRTFETSRKIPETVFSTGQSTIVEDLLDEGVAGFHTGTVALGIRHVLCTPLRLVRYVDKAEDRADERIIGVLYLDSRSRGALKSPSTRVALDTLSTEAAMAIENARLYREAHERAKLDQELKVAAAIQQSLLPASARTGSFFTTAGTSVPCRAVGGDFFDYADLPEGSFGFILGDVAGKGPAAALLASAALGMFSAEATYQQSAALVLTRLNRGLRRRAVEGRFITAFYGMLGPEGSFIYSNAGHNAPLLVSADGVRRLETGGTVLGLFEGASYAEETLAMRPGDIVIAFSDGVTEALNDDGEEFTDERLLASVDAHRQDTPQALLDALLADVQAFSGEAAPSDDVTVVIVRYDGPR